ncbi:MAG: 1,4-alpha-glucan branching enzyme, partial [Nitrosomonas sp.]
MITVRKTNVMQNALLDARLHDPYAYLGLHREQGQTLVRVFRPYDVQVWIRTATGFEPMQRIHPDGIFEWRGDTAPAMPYRLRIEKKG